MTPERPRGTADRDAPVFRIVSDEGLRRIHGAAISLLQDPGVQVTTEAARTLLLDAGCSAAGEDVVRIPESIVDEALSSAPKSFALHDRDGRERVFLGEGRAYFGTGITSLNYQDPATDEVRDFTVEDIAAVARLTDALANLDFAATPGVVRPSADVPLSLVNQHEFLAMVTNTTKPIMTLVADADALSDVLDMAAVVAGGREELRRRPFVVPYLNPVTPLMFNVDTLDKLLLAADWGIPVVCEAAPNLGATSPVTVAGTTAITAAETLAGLVISQLRRKGTPYISGSVPMVMDMRTGDISGGGAPGLLALLASTELAHFWGLPVVGAGGSTDSKVADAQAAVDLSHYVMADILAGVDLSFDVGSTEFGLSHSPIVTVLADETISMLRGMMSGVPTDDESLALEEIREAGIGGQFLASPHTLRHFRELWTPTLLSWESRRIWEAAGSETMSDRARKRAVELIESHRPEPLAADKLAAMESIVEDRRAKAGA